MSITTQEIKIWITKEEKSLKQSLKQHRINDCGMGECNDWGSLDTLKKLKKYIKCGKLG